MITARWPASRAGCARSLAGEGRLIFVPQWTKRENNGFSSPFLANPVDIAGLSRLDQAAAAPRPEASPERVAALARLSSDEASRLRLEGAVLFARNLGPDSRARIAEPFPAPDPVPGSG